MDKTTALFWLNEIKKLHGARIVKGIMDTDTDPDNVWWGFQAVKKDGTSFNVWVQGDDEGNYPGALSIDTYPPASKRPGHKDAEGSPLNLTPEQVEARDKILEAHPWMEKGAKP
jgi:hypothetical protein